MECNTIFHRDVNKIKKGESMKVFNYVIFILIIMFAGASQADDNSKKKLIEELLEVTDADRMVDQMSDRFAPMLQQMFEQAGGEKKDLPIINKYTEKMAEIYKEEMKWELLEKDFTEIYAKVFSESEIKAMVEFYKTEAGKSMIEKMPQVIQESMAVSQRFMKNIMQRMQEIEKEIAEEFNSSKKKTLQVH